jgi:hypothetical protein
MRRRARVIHLARRRLDPLLLELKSKPTKEWPPHLNEAYKLLRGRKADLSDKATRSVVVRSISAAQACARKINRRSDDVVRYRAVGTLATAFRRIANCAKRAPLKLRKRLNETVVPLILNKSVDPEIIDAMFDAVAKIFLEFPEEESATTALRVMCGLPPDHDHVIVIKSNFSVLDNAYQRKAEKAIYAIANASNKKIAVSDIFDALASTLDAGQSNKVSTEIHTLIVDYVAEVAKVWLAAGLKPSRASHQYDRKYTSRFHRFVDLVLTAVTEPWTLRHLVSVDDVHRQARLAHAKLLAELRRIASPAPKQTDIMWPVSEDHIKKALRKLSKKHASILHKN